MQTKVCISPVHTHQVLLCSYPLPHLLVLCLGILQLPRPFMCMLFVLQTDTHDTDKCPFAHPGEKAVRRDVRVYKYSPEACPATQVESQLAGKQVTRRRCLSLTQVDARLVHFHLYTCACIMRCAVSPASPAASMCASSAGLLGQLPCQLTVSFFQCLQQKNGKCPRGLDCPLSHTVFERWLHPRR